MTQVQVFCINYIPNNPHYDFKLMINSDKYQDTLFLYNDDIENRTSSLVTKYTKGNAIIRKYNSFNNNLIKPRSAGIVTGSLKTKGFTTLDKKNIDLIDQSFSLIEFIIKEHKYHKVIFSGDKNNFIGSNIFNLNHEIKIYITQKIWDLNKIYI